VQRKVERGSAHPRSGVGDLPHFLENCTKFSNRSNILEHLIRFLQCHGRLQKVKTRSAHASSGVGRDPRFLKNSRKAENVLILQKLWRIQSDFCSAMHDREKVKWKSTQVVKTKDSLIYHKEKTVHMSFFPCSQWWCINSLSWLNWWRVDGMKIFV